MMEEIGVEKEVETLFRDVARSTYSLSSLESEKIDYERLEKAGSVVQPKNYEKRVRVLLYQLPKGVVEEIELKKLKTPLLSFKLDKMEEWKDKSYEFIPKQNRYTEEDVLNAYNEYYERIYKALVEEAKRFDPAYV